VSAADPDAIPQDIPESAVGRSIRDALALPPRGMIRGRKLNAMETQ